VEHLAKYQKLKQAPRSPLEGGGSKPIAFFLVVGWVDHVKKI